MKMLEEVRRGSVWIAIGMLLAMLGFQSCEVEALRARVEALEVKR